MNNNASGENGRSNCLVPVSYYSFSLVDYTGIILSIIDIYEENA